MQSSSISHGHDNISLSLAFGCGYPIHESIDVDIITFGQYLRPSNAHLPVKRFVPPWELHRSMTYIITVYIGGKRVPKSLVVADAVWCGMCKPQPEPIEMPYLD